MGAYAPIEVGCEAYILRGGKLLLGQRKNVYGDGTWGLPGGRVKLMERAGDALIRELGEELGITVFPADIELIAVTDDPEPELKSHHLHITFRVDIGSQEPKLIEPEACSEWRWYRLSELPEPMFAPHQKILRTIKSGKSYL